MEVSTFELLYKRQAPASPIGSPPVDRALQGYFLQIANLEAAEYAYRVEFVTALPPPGTPEAELRSLEGNTLTFVDTGGTDNRGGVLTSLGVPGVFAPSSGFIRVPPGGSALLAVLPSIFPSPLDPTPIGVDRFEVRGYVRIFLPALRRAVPPFQIPLFTTPQSAGPVRVMLTAQNRTVFVATDGTIREQVQASLPPAAGSAVISLPPEPGGPIVLTPFTARAAISPLLDRIPPGLQADVLRGLLAQIDPETADLAAFNRSLAELQVPLRLEAQQAAKAG